MTGLPLEWWEDLQHKLDLAMANYYTEKTTPGDHTDKLLFQNPKGLQMLFDYINAKIKSLSE